MTRDFARKCSHCGHNGHNSRTCNNGKGCFKLFGVKINLDQEEKRNLDVEKTEKVHESMRKSKSMGNLLACNPENNVPDAGYLSDGIVHKSEHERKKGVPWTEDEHRSFLTGLEHLGKGDWRGISKNYVPTRTPTQVASHAQKYFIRKTATDKRKRRSSLFDIPFNESTPPAPQASIASPSDKASEISQQVSATVVASSKNSSKNQGQASTSAHVAPSEKPPLSPMARTYVPDFYRMPYMVQVPGGQSFPAADVVPTVFFPYMNYPNPGYVYFPPGGEMFPACAPYMNQMSSGPLPGPFPLSHGSSEAGSATSAAKKDGLEASIGALSI